MTLSEEARAELRAKAEAACEGEPPSETGHWLVRDRVEYVLAGESGIRVRFPVTRVEPDWSDGDVSICCEMDEHAQYIAAANPATVIALLDHIDALTAERDRLRAALEEVIAVDCGAGNNECANESHRKGKAALAAQPEKRKLRPYNPNAGAAADQQWLSDWDAATLEERQAAIDEAKAVQPEALTGKYPFRVERTGRASDDGLSDANAGPATGRPRG